VEREGLIAAPIDNMVYCDWPPFGFRILEIRPSLVERLDMPTNIRDRPKRGRRNLDECLAALVKDFYLPLRARLNFAVTWGLSGINRLARARYSQPTI
jgi:hypothetical protein